MPPKAQISGNQKFFCVLALSLILFVLHFFHLIEFHELDAIDLRLKLRGEHKASPEIVIVEIDDASLAAIGQWPWPRSIHAVLLDVLANYQPRLDFFDVLFTEANPDPAEDEKLKFAIRKSGNVLLPFYYYSEKPFGAFFPIPPLRESVTNVGFENIDPDRDVRLRRIRASIDSGTEVFYHPALLIGSCLEGDCKVAANQAKRIPQDKQNRFWINYPGPISAFKRVSFSQVIAAAGTDVDETMKKIFAGKVVIIGHTATGTTDLKPTPFSASEVGVAIQASAIDTILNKKFLRSSPWFLDFVILLFLSFLAAGFAEFFTPMRGLGITIGLVSVYAVLNFLLFVGLGWILPLFLPMAGAGLSYVGMLFFKYLEILFQGQLLSRELQTAARIQETFLPHETPTVPGVDAAFECHFAKQVGGDLYDWSDFGNGQLGICVGDVSGKGVPAALYMAKVISDFRREIKPELSPGKVCDKMNQILTSGGSSGMFLTLFYGVIHQHSQKLDFTSAGHEPLIFYRHSEQRAEIIGEGAGKPLGLFEEELYETREILWQKGDAFLLLSDGVKELRNPQGQEWGIETLKNLFQKEAAKGSSAREIVDHLFKEMQHHQKGVAAHDDRTLFCVKFLA